MKNLFILAGPTGIGKSDISLKLATKLNGEIISTDSMQIYKEMDIGSAKLAKEEMQGIPHHIIDFLDPKENFNVSDFKNLSEKVIDEISKRKKLPMMVGGTGLYIDSLICSFDFTDAEKDEEYREFLINEAELKGKEYVHSLLENVDIESFKRLYPNDLKRIIRALEVYKLTGKTISEYNALNKQNRKVPYNVHYYVLTMDRESLYKRIDRRVDIMLEKGLVNEVKSLKEKGMTADMQSMKGIGYKEILNYLDDKITYEDAVYLIKKGSRNYAKRQLTWFRKDERVKFVNKDSFSSEDDIVKYISEDFANSLNEIKLKENSTCI